MNIIINDIVINKTLLFKKSYLGYTLNLLSVVP